MSRTKAVFMLIAVLLLTESAPAWAWRGASVRFGVFIGAPLYPWFYPPYYYYPPYPPVVAVPAAPTTYIEQGSAPSPSYWYYCEASRTYYPYVKECPAGWLRVVPQATPPAARPAPQTAPRAAPSAPQAKPPSPPQTASNG